MKIRVVRKTDDKDELLELPEGPLRVESHNSYMWKLCAADGMEHFFYHIDGKYDGWGKNVEGKTEEEAMKTIEDVESKRQVSEEPRSTKWKPS